MANEMGEMLSATSINPGDVVTGTVTDVDDKKVTVELSHPFPGMIPIRELSPLHIEHPSEVVKVGDEVRATVVKVDEEAGVVVLSKRQAAATEAWDQLRDRFERQEAFDVTINDVVKGGLVTDVGVRGFIPASMVETHYVEDLTPYKGQTLRVVVNEIDAEDNKLILSHKGALEHDQHSQRTEVLKSLQEGAILDGIVRRLAPFGAFVDVGGVDGLVHISELSWQRVNRPEETVQVGDHVRVKVLKTDPESGKISLSVKQATADPWSQVLSTFHEGEVINGTVQRVVDFGAFVEIAPGVEGLVHVSQLSNQRIAKASDAVREGELVKVKVLSVDPDRKRISLSMKEAQGGRNRKEVQSFLEKQTTTGGTGATLGDLFGDLFKK